MTPAALERYLAAHRRTVERALRGFMKSHPGRPAELAAAMRYAVLGPGKRLRPVLALASAEVVGGAGAVSRAVPFGCALELIHAYSLVHDDLPAMDDDDERRGRPTVHIAFGEAIAILAGDGLLTEAFAVLAELGPRAGDAVRVLAQRAGRAELLLGQAIDLTAPPKTLAEIERLHAAKTGALFAAAGELGAIAAGASPATCAALGRYGLAIGIAFQHADDRDDAELVEHAAVAATRMRELCTAARTEISPLGASGALLDAIAAWILGRA